MTYQNEQISLEDIQSLTKILASVIWVDGEYSEEEKRMMAKIAGELKIDVALFCQLIEKEVSIISGLSSTLITYYLKEAATTVSIEYRNLFFEYGLRLILLDNKLTYAEMSTILVLSSALELDDEYAMLLVVQKTCKNPSLEVELF